MKIHIIPILQDNYCYAIVDGKRCAIVDPGEAGPVIAFCERQGVTPELILLTHHHGDHTGGAAAIKTRFKARVIGPAAERHRIGAMDEGVAGGDTIPVCGADAHILATPGHTNGHIAFYIPALAVVFTGDALFSLGCGRLMEGDAPTLWASLQALCALHDATNIYCGHEYTEANGLFALSVDPDNADLIHRVQDVAAMRASGSPSVPVSLAVEKATNPFLRAGTAERFGELRRLKDRF